MEQGPIVETLRALARRNAAALAENPKVAAIAVTGSVARGLADGYSDIDTIVYYHELPSEEERNRAYAAMGATSGGLYGEDPEGVAEFRYVDGVRCDFGHLLLESWERRMDEVQRDFSTDWINHKMASGVSDALPLYGEATIRAWQERLASYPDGLAEALVRQHLRFASPWVLEHRLLAHDGLIFFEDLKVQMAKNVFGVLVGLNRLYNPIDYKHLAFWAAKMAWAPVDLAPRLRAAFEAGPREGLTVLSALVADTLALVETHMPQIDTREVRERFEHRERVRVGAQD